MEYTRRGLAHMTLSNQDQPDRGELEVRLSMALRYFRDANIEWRKVDAHVMNRILTHASEPSHP